MSESSFKIDPTKFGVQRTHPGWIYVIQHQELIKVGKTKNPKKRFSGAMTWLPDMLVFGCKPFWNYAFVERSLHVGLSNYWYDREWFKIDDGFRDEFLQEFDAFSDENRDTNSVNFIYWMNGSGMSELCHEQCSQKKTLPKFRSFISVGKNR